MNEESKRICLTTGLAGLKVIQIFKNCGIDGYPKEEEVSQVQSNIITIENILKKKLIYTEIDLIQELLDEYQGLRVLVQVLTASVSAETCAMVYCVLRGMEIEEIKLSYLLGEKIYLGFELKDNRCENYYCFESTSVWDVRVLSYLGLMESKGKPYILNFYPLG